MIRLQGWKGQGVRPHLVGVENLTFALGWEKMQRATCEAEHGKASAGTRTSSFCEDSLASGTWYHQKVGKG